MTTNLEDVDDAIGVATDINGLAHDALEALNAVRQAVEDKNADAYGGAVSDLTSAALQLQDLANELDQKAYHLDFAGTEDDDENDDDGGTVSLIGDALNVTSLDPTVASASRDS
jgi:hypothetical protein